MAYRLIALDKAPWLFQALVGEIIHCLLAKCILLLTSAMLIDACGNLNLCAGLGSDIEGDLHATMDKCNKTQFPKVSDQDLLVGGSYREEVFRGAEQR